MAEAYACPDMLVETDWLAAHLEDPTLRVVDADYPHAYGRAHIPGAVGHLSDNAYLKTRTGEVHVMGPEQAAETFARMGIGDDTSVVVYDGDRSRLATRFWWVLTYYGHRDVRVLNGGFDRWLAEGRPLTMARPTVAPATFTPRARKAASSPVATVVLPCPDAGAAWSGAMAPAARCRTPRRAPPGLRRRWGRTARAARGGRRRSSGTTWRSSIVRPPWRA